MHELPCFSCSRLWQALDQITGTRKEPGLTWEIGVPVTLRFLLQEPLESRVEMETATFGCNRWS